jgi:hypothetical protein
MIYRSVCSKCNQEIYYTCSEESKYATPICCGKPTTYKEKNCKLNCNSDDRKLNEK